MTRVSILASDLLAAAGAVVAVVTAHLVASGDGFAAIIDGQGAGGGDRGERRSAEVRAVTVGAGGCSVAGRRAMLTHPVLADGVDPVRTARNGRRHGGMAHQAF